MKLYVAQVIVDNDTTLKFDITNRSMVKYYVNFNNYTHEVIFISPVPFEVDIEEIHSVGLIMNYIIQSKEICISSTADIENVASLIRRSK